MKTKGGTWTFEELNKFLTNPRGYIPGTNMTFAGLSRDSQRADVIAFLRTQSDNPLPLPKAAENAPAPAGAAPAARQACRSAQSRRSAKEVVGAARNVLMRPGLMPGRFVLCPGTATAAAGRWWRTEKPT